MQISETILLIVIALITGISALFCIISLATPRWSLTQGLYCDNCSQPASGLAIVAFILLIVALVIICLFIARILPNSVRALGVIVVFLGVIFTLSAFASYFKDWSGYSYKLMVVSNFFCVVATVMAGFWLGGSYAASVARTN